MTIAQTGQIITFTGSASGKRGTSNSFNIDAGDIDHYLVSNIRSPQACGWPFDVTIQAQDQYNNNITTGNETVDFTFNETDGGATPTSISTTNGTATVSVIMTIAQTGQSITFTGSPSGKSVISNLFDVIVGSSITGLTYEVKGLVLPGVTIKLIKDGVVKATAVSDSQGNYGIIAPETGTYSVIASKAGFRDETQSIGVNTLGQIYPLNFKGKGGIIPNATDIWYVLDCAALWKYPPADPELGLDIWKVLDVAAAWKYPIQ